MRCILIALYALALPASMPAQTTEADLTTRLVAKQLYLRGRWGADKLAFDGSGQMAGSPRAISYTLAGLQINSVKLKGDGLVLEGQRYGIIFQKDVPKLIGLVGQDGPGLTHPERITIRIQRPQNGDFTSALDAIFTGNFEELPAGQPEWERFARLHFSNPQTSSKPADITTADSPARLPAEKVARIGGPVSSPKVLKYAEPQFNDQARALKYSGVVLLNLVVDTEGKPGRIRILHPIGLGLDERAVEAVSRYVFQPAMQQGEPVPVELNIEVNYQIF